jgi:hypothetical protein
MIAYALSGSNVLEANKIFWEVPLKNIWVMLWCYYQYNGVETKRIGEADNGAIINDQGSPRHSK